VAIFLVLCAVTNADVYMHNPRGSNDRNCERNVNRNNANRLFDSQNNAKGGYACPRAVGGPETKTPRMFYYGDSILPIEWTAQHGCGDNDKNRCDIVIQYMCSNDAPGMRDGTPNDVNDAATDRIDFDPNDSSKSDDKRDGQHEPWSFYKKCFERERNMGLFTADQRLNGKNAIRTRQNPNGQRYGLECPEERDYYPYWHPTPWRDIAVITSNPSRCEYYRKESQNVQPKGECVHQNGPKPSEAGPRRLSWYNNKEACESVDPRRTDADKGRTQKWVEVEDWDMDPPVCLDGKDFWSRVNHLGNGVGGYPLTFNWTLPNIDQDGCVIRIRYNISTMDYPGRDGLPYDDDDDGSSEDYFTTRDLKSDPEYESFFNSTRNGKNSTIQQDPYVDIGEDRYLSLALNTNQYGRVFQDRSYLFDIKKKEVSGKIWNLNVRGKRGNIVQVYPAVEYDFVPNKLVMHEDDYIHIQWTGSDYNPRRGCNDAEGGPPDKADGNPQLNPRADRSNFIELYNAAHNFPMNISDIRERSMFDPDDDDDMEDIIYRLAYIDQDLDDCDTLEELQKIANKNEREYRVGNCFKLNAAPTPYFNFGLAQMKRKGIFHYYCSRNTNFSNRNQKGTIIVVDKDTDIEYSSQDSVDKRSEPEAEAEARAVQSAVAVEDADPTVTDSAHVATISWADSGELVRGRAFLDGVSALRAMADDDDDESGTIPDAEEAGEDNDAAGDGVREGCGTRAAAGKAGGKSSSSDDDSDEDSADSKEGASKTTGGKKGGSSSNDDDSSDDSRAGGQKSGDKAKADEGDGGRSGVPVALVVVFIVLGLAIGGVVGFAGAVFILKGRRGFSDLRSSLLP